MTEKKEYKTKVEDAFESKLVNDKGEVVHVSRLSFEQIKNSGLLNYYEKKNQQK